MLQEESWGKLLNPLTPVRTICQNWFFLRQFTLRNIQSRFKGSFLGVLWLLAYPLMMLSIYTFVFCVVFRAKWGDVPGYTNSKLLFALMLFCGMAVFNVFSDSLGGGVSAIVSRPNFVKKINTPLELLPVAMVLSALLLTLLWFAVLLVTILFAYKGIPITALWLPVLLVPLVLLSLGSAWLVASLGVYIRDFGQAIPIFTQVVFFLTPIFYSVDMIPEEYRFILALNPLTGMVENMRLILLQGQHPDLMRWLWQTVGTLIFSQLCYVWFMKTKRGFADVM